MFPLGEISLASEIPGLTEIADISRALAELSRNILPEDAGHAFLGITGGAMQVLYSFSESEQRELLKETYCKKLFFVSVDGDARMLILEDVDLDEFPAHVKRILIPQVKVYMAQRGYVSIS